jgi:hypothetical protein
MLDSQFRGHLLGGLVALVLTVTSPAIHASSQTFYFAGQIGGEYDPHELSIFSLGTSFAGSYTFDAATPGNFGEVTAAHYTNAITSASITVGGLTYTTPVGASSDIYISQSSGPFVFDYYSVWVPELVGPTIAGGAFVGPHMNLYFTDSSSSTFPDLSLPTSPPPASGFGFDIRWFEPTGEWAYLASGTLSGISTTSPIPEPETYAMLLAGLGLLGFTARRRQLKLAI